MPGPLDLITGHYKANERCHKDVPEWAGDDGVPLRIHWRRLNPEERARINETCETDLDIFVLKAQHEDGKAMFSKEDKPKLRRAGDSVIISNVVAAMLGQARISKSDVDDAEKN